MQRSRILYGICPKSAAVLHVCTLHNRELALPVPEAADIDVKLTLHRGGCHNQAAEWMRWTPAFRCLDGALIAAMGKNDSNIGLVRSQYCVS